MNRELCVYKPGSDFGKGEGAFGSVVKQTVDFCLRVDWDTNTTAISEGKGFRRVERLGLSSLADVEVVSREHDLPGPMLEHAAAALVDRELGGVADDDHSMRVRDIREPRKVALGTDLHEPVNHAELAVGEERLDRRLGVGRRVGDVGFDTAGRVRVGLVGRVHKVLLEAALDGADGGTETVDRQALG